MQARIGAIAQLYDLISQSSRGRTIAVDAYLREIAETMWQRQPPHPHCLDQVALQRIAPVVIGAVGDARSSGTTAHVVDQDVDPAIGRQGRLD
jgi:hypothetical protein